MFADVFNILGDVDGSATAIIFLDGAGRLLLPIVPTIPTFPTLIGLSWPVKRSPVQSTTTQASISGKDTRRQNWTYGKYRYELTFDYLSSSASIADWQTLMSFFQLVAGSALPFHFNDIADNQVAGQLIGVGDGSTRSFNFQRTLSLITEPTQDVIQGSVTIRLATVAQDPSTYTFLTDPNWGFTYGIQFKSGHTPGAAVPVTADFSYLWPCRFDEDTAEFSQFMYQFWELKKLAFTTMKVI